MVSRSCFIKLDLFAHTYGGSKLSDPVSVRLGWLVAVVEQVCGHSGPDEFGHLSEVIALSLELGLFHLVRFEPSFDSSTSSLYDALPLVERLDTRAGTKGGIVVARGLSKWYWALYTLIAAVQG